MPSHTKEPTAMAFHPAKPQLVVIYSDNKAGYKRCLFSYKTLRYAKISLIKEFHNFLHLWYPVMSCADIRVRSSREGLHGLESSLQRQPARRLGEQEQQDGADHVQRDEPPAALPTRRGTLLYHRPITGVTQRCAVCSFVTLTTVRARVCSYFTKPVLHFYVSKHLNYLCA